jgi:hypothetical protein
MLGLALAGCSTLDPTAGVKRETERMKVGPQGKPFRTITGFTDGLRCMDNLMIGYGVRDLPVLVEDLADKTTKVNAGTRDMLISAISALSARSRAIRLVTFGADVANLANFFANAESKQPYAEAPVYDIRGSISQFDESLSRRQGEGGVSFAWFGLGGAKSAEASILAIDLNVIYARNYAVVPGVSASNSVAVLKLGSGVDAEAEYRKLGVNFNVTLSRSEGRAQALRTLVELSAIELIGKLTRTPYWTCIAADVSGDLVDRQIADWFHALSINGELVGYMQAQLAHRGAYRGPIDGQWRPELQRAVAAYRVQLGMSEAAKIDQELFRRHLRVAPLKPATLAKPLAHAPAKPASAPPQMALGRRAGIDASTAAHR